MRSTAIESNKEIVRRFVTAAFFNGNSDAVDEYVTDEFVRHGPDVDEVHGANGTNGSSNG